MILRFMIGIALISFSAGCTTTHQPTDVGRLKIRLAQVEGQLDDQNQEIEDLKSSIDDLSVHVRHISLVNKPVSKEKEVKMPSTKQVSKPKRQHILRVAVPPREVQSALKNAGYYKGTLDGILGAGSKKAIEEFQKDHDLESDGIIGKKTWAELKNYSGGDGETYY